MRKSYTHFLVMHAWRVLCCCTISFKIPVTNFVFFSYWTQCSRQFTAMLQSKLVVVLMLASVAYFQTTDRPPWYQGCINTNECAATECCVLSGTPNTIATCNALIEEGNPCRPNNAPVNTTITFPNGDSVNLTNVYLNLCYCVGGLTCIQGICERNVLEVQPQNLVPLPWSLTDFNVCLIFTVTSIFVK